MVSAAGWGARAEGERGLNVKNALETLAGLAEWELEVAANLGIYQGFVFLGIEQVSGHSRQKDFFLC